MMLAKEHTHCHSQKVHNRAAPQEDREPQQNPWQVGSREIEDSQKAESDIWIPPAPHVHLNGRSNQQISKPT